MDWHMDPSFRFHCRRCVHNALTVYIASISLWSITFVPFCTCSAAINPQNYSYDSYCHDILHGSEEQQTSTPFTSPSRSNLNVQRASFKGGFPLFDIASAGFSLRKQGPTASFIVQNLTHTDQDGTFLVEGTLTLRNRTRYWFDRTRTFKRDPSAKRAPFSQSGYVRMNTKGVLAAKAGILCMAACSQKNVQIGRWQSNGQEDCQVKATIYYPPQVSLTHSLLKGKLESQRERSDPLFFEPILLTSVPGAPYFYTEEEELQRVCALRQTDVPANIKVWKDDSAACHFPFHKQPFSVTWDRHCSGQDCSPFGGIDSRTKASLSIENMLCAGGMVHGYLVFNFKSHQGGEYARYEVLAVEGKWNATTGQLCMSSCYLKGAANGSLTYESSCGIIITLQFPITLNLLFRYSIIGHIESGQSSASPSFRPFAFTGHMDITYGSLGWGKSPPLMEYLYTDEKLSQVRKTCQADTDAEVQNMTGHRTLNYPDGQVFSDLAFRSILKEPSGFKAEAYFSLISVNQRVNRFSQLHLPTVTPVVARQKNPSLNVSFSLNFEHSMEHLKLLHNTSLYTLSAEGVYNPNSGVLCLIACRLVDLSAQHTTQLDGDDKDCQIAVTLEYPPMNPSYFGKRRVHGQIVSLREQSDSLFFDTVSISSDSIVYHEQATDTLLQIDLEIIMGIASLTMATIFISIQLRHVKKNPDALLNTSLLMLLVLTLGHLIPLVLNFEAIFSSRSRQNVLQWSGGWLEINEVVVRLMTMLVFLLLIRFLHLVWTSKATFGAPRGPLLMERNVFFVCLATYSMGGVVALILYANRGGNFFDSLKEYTGLMVDFFLFPQIVGSCIWGVQGVVLSFPFYSGMTLVRLLPHVYDTVRKFEFLSFQNRRVYYANPSWDFYSNSWDAIIPCVCLVFALVVFLQQRFGGACLLPCPWRQRISYQELSTCSLRTEM